MTVIACSRSRTQRRFCVAAVARRGPMRTGEWKFCKRVVEPRPPGDRIKPMTQCTVRRKAGGLMIGILRLRVLLTMASDTRGRDAGVSNPYAGGVASLALRNCVLPHEWEPGLLMPLTHIRHEPRSSGMTTRAVIPQFAFVNIRVARLTGALRTGESEALMARCAFRRFVRSCERKSG